MDIAIAGAYAIYRFMERTAERVSNGVRWETIKDMMMRLFGWLIVAIALSGPNNLCAASEIDTLVVLHTNDFHGYISPDGDRTAGLARIAAYFNHERARGANVLAIDGGDCVSGTPVSILFKGRPIFEAMSVAGYDAAVLGNHEFDYGWREILAYRDLANFPLLSVNARSADGKLIADAPSVMLERSGLRIGRRRNFRRGCKFWTGSSETSWGRSPLQRNRLDSEAGQNRKLGVQNRRLGSKSKVGVEIAG